MSLAKKYPYLGAKKDKKDKRDFRVAGIMSPVGLPSRFALEEKYKPKNQHSRGSCTSQGQTHHKERQEKKRMSARFVMALTKRIEQNTRYGAYTRNSFKAVKEYGACSDKLLPEPGPEMSWDEYIDITKIPTECFGDAMKHKSESYWRVDKSINAIKQTLHKFKNSIVISMAWYEEFNKPPLGFLPLEFSKYIGGHAVECVGYNDNTEMLKFKNSWGSAWGKDGYFYMSYDLFDRVVWDCWCSLDLPDSYPVDNYYGIERTWLSYMRERAVAFNIWLNRKIGRLPSNREIKGLAYGFWSYHAVFEGKVGDIWLKMTKPEAVYKGLIDKEENIL